MKTNKLKIVKIIYEKFYNTNDLEQFENQNRKLLNDVRKELKDKNLTTKEIIKLTKEIELQDKYVLFVYTKTKRNRKNRKPIEVLDRYKFFEGVSLIEIENKKYSKILERFKVLFPISKDYLYNMHRNRGYYIFPCEEQNFVYLIFRWYLTFSVSWIIFLMEF